MNERDELQEFDLDDIMNEFHEEPEEEQPDVEELPEEDLTEEPLTEPQSSVTGDTLVHQAPVKDPVQEISEEDDTLRLEKLSDVPPMPQAEEPEPQPRVIEIDPRLRLRELKKALIAGPENATTSWIRRA